MKLFIGLLLAFATNVVVSETNSITWNDVPFIIMEGEPLTIGGYIVSIKVPTDEINDLDKLEQHKTLISSKTRQSGIYARHVSTIYVRDYYSPYLLFSYYVVVHDDNKMQCDRTITLTAIVDNHTYNRKIKVFDDECYPSSP